MENFKNTSDKLFSGPGIQLKQRVITEVDYYNYIEKSLYLKGKSLRIQMDLSQAFTSF